MLKDFRLSIPVPNTGLPEERSHRDEKIQLAAEVSKRGSLQRTYLGLLTASFSIWSIRERVLVSLPIQVNVGQLYITLIRTTFRVTGRSVTNYLGAALLSHKNFPPDETDLTLALSSAPSLFIYRFSGERSVVCLRVINV